MTLMKDVVARIFTALTIIGFAVLVSGCMSTENAQNATQYVQHSKHHQELIHELQDCCVQITQVGDSMTIAIPTDHFFYLDGKLNPRMQPTMAAIADLVKTYLPRPVTVMGHTDQVGTRTQLINKSKDHAFIIASYLWAQNIPLKLMTVKGEANDQPIASNRTVDGAAANRRVDVVVG